MFFCESGRAYTLMGVYHVVRENDFDRIEKGRGYTSLAIRIRGSSTFFTKNRELEAPKGTIIYIPRGIGFRRHSAETEELIILHLHCHGEDDSEISILSCADAEILFRRLLETWESMEIGRHHRCMSLLYHIFETLERLYGNARQRPPSAIWNGVEHLFAHYRDPDLTVSQLASYSHVSEVYFRKLYQATYGESPWQTVLRLRFDYAAECLSTGYYTVKEVAANAGFSDLKHFRVSFTERFGVSPTEYVRQNG